MSIRKLLKNIRNRASSLYNDHECKYSREEFVSAELKKLGFVHADFENLCEVLRSQISDAALTNLSKRGKKTPFDFDSVYRKLKFNIDTKDIAPADFKEPEIFVGFYDTTQMQGHVFVDKLHFATFEKDSVGELNVCIYAMVIGEENNKAPVGYNVKNIVRRYLINEYERNFQPEKLKDATF